MIYLKESKSMSTYYIYRMSCDTGNAPCVFDREGNTTGLLSLACCKGGQIRHYKNGKITHVKTGLRKVAGENFIENREKGGNEEFYVIGILHDKVIYAAKITEVLTMPKYFSNEKYRNRKDCIYDCVPKYEPDDNIENYSLERRENFNDQFHGQDDDRDCRCSAEATEQHIRDELGVYVLLSDVFSYFGGQAEPIDGSVMKYMPEHQETKTYKSCEIESFAEKLISKKCISGKPTTELKNENRKTKGCQK